MPLVAKTRLHERRPKVRPLLLVGKTHVSKKKHRLNQFADAYSQKSGAFGSYQVLR